MLRTIHLHGILAEKFGPQFELDVETPAEAFRALMVLRNGFREALEQGEWVVIRGRERHGWELDSDHLQLRFGKARELHVLPAPTGRGGGGGSKIIIGAVLILAAALTYGAALGAFGATAAGALGSTGAAAGMAGATVTGWGAMVAGSVLGLGISMTMAGVSQMLAPQPKGRTEVQQNPSYIFQGPVNAEGQGFAMPLIYGRIRVGSRVGSATLIAQEYTSPPMSVVSGKTGLLASVHGTARVTTA